MKTSKQSFVIFVPGNRGPSVSHDSIESARTEAKRLVESAGVSQALICQFVEGVEKVTTVKTLKKNPLMLHADIF